MQDCVGYQSFSSAHPFVPHTLLAVPHTVPLLVMYRQHYVVLVCDVGPILECFTAVPHSTVHAVGNGGRLGWEKAVSVLSGECWYHRWPYTGIGEGR